MPRSARLSLSRLVEHLARLSPPRHRELARGMVAELESIVDPAERRRFALGAIAALARLALAGFRRVGCPAPRRLVPLENPVDGSHSRGGSMSTLTTWRLLRLHATPFAASFASLTGLLLANYAVRQVPHLSARGVPTGEIVAAVLLAAPFVVALTIPMAVFIAVSWVFTRLGAEGVLTAIGRDRRGTRRLVAPVLAAAAVVGTITLFSNAQVVPRANARLSAVLGDGASDRTMTIGELRQAARTARTATGASDRARAAAYEVEIQKKLALAAACVVLALLGAAAAIRFPRGGLALLIGASAVVFPGYYYLVVTGESLADRQVVSPLVGMWTANALLLAIGLLLVWRPSRAGPASGAEALAIDG